MPMIDTGLYAVTSTDDYVVGPTNFVISGPNAKYIAWSEIRGPIEIKNACLAIRLGWSGADSLVRIVGDPVHLQRIADVANCYRDAGQLMLAAMLSPEPVDDPFERLYEKITVYREEWMD